jgi:hypothetical protein
VQPHLVPFADELPCLWQLVHGSQATGTDIDRACNTIDLDAATVHIQHKTTARALLRERHIVAMHGLAFAYFTTTRHIFFLSILGQTLPRALPLTIQPDFDILF